MTSRITQSMISRSMLADLNDVANRLAATQRKMSSGKQITRPSDDPYGTARALKLQSDLQSQIQYGRNVDEALSWQTVTDSALSNITAALQRARELMVAGASDASGPDARNADADEIDQLIESVKQSANTSYAGSFVFAGTDTKTRPYGAADAYQGDSGTIAREIGPGVSVNVNVVAQDILGDGQGADNLLIATLRDAAQHLRGTTDADADALRTTDLQHIDDNLKTLLAARATVGATTNRLEAAQGRLGELQESSKKLLSDVQDADMAQTLIDFSTQQAGYNAALQAGGHIIQLSLLDFLA